MMHCRENYIPCESYKVDISHPENRSHKVKVEELGSRPNAEIYHVDWNEGLFAVSHTSGPCFSLHKCKTRDETCVEWNGV